MKDSIFFRCWLGFILLSVAGCAPQAVYFHESTKVGFSADYTASDSEPLSTHFGYKRRIVAVVPTKNRKSPTSNEADAVNKGEALSTISKFYVKVDPSNELVIRNNFATGNAAKALLSGSTSSAIAVAGLMHSSPVITNSNGAVLRIDDSAMSVADVAASRAARIKKKIIGGTSTATLPQISRSQSGSQAELFVDKVTGKIMKRIKKADGTEDILPYKQ